MVPSSLLEPKCQPPHETISGTPKLYSTPFSRFSIPDCALAHVIAFMPTCWLVELGILSIHLLNFVVAYIFVYITNRSRNNLLWSCLLDADICRPLVRRKPCVIRLRRAFCLHSPFHPKCGAVDSNASLAALFSKYYISNLIVGASSLRSPRTRGRGSSESELGQGPESRLQGARDQRVGNTDQEPMTMDQGPGTREQGPVTRDQRP